MTESLVDRLRRLNQEWDKPVDFQGYSAVVMSSRELLRSGAGKWVVDDEARKTFVLLIDALPALLRLVEAAKELYNEETCDLGNRLPEIPELQTLRVVLAALDAPEAQTNG